MILSLLWCIYFNPLLCEINELNIGYIISHKWMINISKNIHNQIEEMISALGFMDDTNWIFSFQENLEDILAVTDNFYHLIHTAINKEKSKLLTNIIADHIPITINFDCTLVLIELFFNTIRFLSININIYLNHALVKKNLRAHIRQFIYLIRLKLITDRQFSYII